MTFADSLPTSPESISMIWSELVTRQIKIQPVSGFPPHGHSHPTCLQTSIPNPAEKASDPPSDRLGSWSRRLGSPCLPQSATVQSKVSWRIYSKSLRWMAQALHTGGCASCCSRELNEMRIFLPGDKLTSSPRLALIVDHWFPSRASPGRFHWSYCPAP